MTADRRAFYWAWATALFWLFVVIGAAGGVYAIAMAI